MADRAANLRITVGSNVLVESATEKHRKNREVRNSCGVLGGNVADRAANLRITVGSNVLVESATEKHRKNREVRNSCGVL